MINHCRGCWLFLCLAISSLCYGAAQFVTAPIDWAFMGLFYLMCMFMGVLISRQIDTKFDDRIEAQELRTLQIRKLSDVANEKQRRQLSIKIDKKSKWIKSWVSLFVGVISSFGAADFFGWSIPSLTMALIGAIMSAFGPIIFLGFLGAVIRIDYTSILISILTSLMNNLTQMIGGLERIRKNKDPKD